MKKIACLAAGLLLSGSALGADDGYYMGLQVGKATTDYTANQLKIDNISVPRGPAVTTTTKKSFGFRLYGGYQYNEYLAAEFGVTRFGELTVDGIYGISGANINVRPYGLDLVGKVMMPVADNFAPYVKLGVIDSLVTFNANTSARPLNTKFKKSIQQSQFRATYGIGVSYDFSAQISADLSWMFVVGGGGNLVTNMRLGSLGIAYHFS